MTSTESIGERLQREVLTPLKHDFVGKDEIVDLLGISLLGGENLFLLGPPGTAKSALIHRLGERLSGRTFSYLLTRFTEPNELFGPFDIRRLREGELVTNTDGMLTEASLVFLDELLNANSAILNSLLTALNEKIVPRGRERIKVQALMFVGASNHLPEDDALLALFDRFLLRVHCENVATDQLVQVLDAGWRLETQPLQPATVSFEEIRQSQSALREISLDGIRHDYAALVQRIRTAGITVSDRRAVKLQRIIAASALLCGRTQARHSDLWVLRHVWHTEDQRQVLAAIVNEFVNQDDQQNDRHPAASSNGAPDPEALARDLEWLEQRANEVSEHPMLSDRLSLLDGRVQWVTNARHRELLEIRVKALWARLQTT